MTKLILYQKFFILDIHATMAAPSEECKQQDLFIG
jgi:hypothetical protein